MRQKNILYCPAMLMLQYRLHWDKLRYGASEAEVYGEMHRRKCADFNRVFNTVNASRVKHIYVLTDFSYRLNDLNQAECARNNRK